MSAVIAPVGVHIFVDHSNMWGGVRLASKLRDPKIGGARARLSVRALNKALGGNRSGVVAKLVSGGIPPGMEGLWEQYQKYGYDTQRLFRDENWKERGVDHTIIGHMWRLLAKNRGGRTRIVLASGDGKRNEFGTSFREVIEEALLHQKYENVEIALACFDWPHPPGGGPRTPMNQRMKGLVENSPRGQFINLMDHYDELVYHE